MWSQSKISAEPQCCECYPYGSLIKAWQSLQQYTMHALPFLLISPQPWHLWSSLLFLSTQRNIKNQKYNASAASLNETKSLSSYINNHSHTSHTRTNTSSTISDTENNKKRCPYDLLFFFLLPNSPVSCFAADQNLSFLHKSRTLPRWDKKIMRNFNDLSLIFPPQCCTYLCKTSQTESNWSVILLLFPCKSWLSD